MQDGVVWAPFGATAWPAKVVAAGKGTSQTALVELLGTGLKIEVKTVALTAWESDCAKKCSQLHSDMGKQVDQQIALNARSVLYKLPN